MGMAGKGGLESAGPLLGMLAGADLTANSFTATAASGANAFIATQGARYSLNAGGTHWIAYDGTNMNFALSNAVYMTINNSTGAISTPYKFNSSIASGSDAFGVTTNGARWHVGAGASDYFSSDGTTISFAGPIVGASTINAVSSYGLNNGAVIYPGGSSRTAIRGNAANGATAISVQSACPVAYTTAGAKIHAFYSDNVSTEVASVDKDGQFTGGFGTSASLTPVKLNGVVNANTTAVGNVGAGTDDLISYTLPANSIVTTGRGVRITAWGTGANNANAKTVTLEFGGQTVMTQALTANQVDNWRISSIVLRTGASTQDVFAELLQSGTAVITKQTITAGTQTETAQIIIKCTGTATDNDDIVQEGLLVESL